MMCATVSQLRADVVPKTAGACLDDWMMDRGWTRD